MDDFNVKTDQAPEGQGKGARDNPAADVSFTNLPHGDDPQSAGDPLRAGEPFGDGLPLDGSLSTSDTEVLDQSGQHRDEDRVLQGSEAGGTADDALDSLQSGQTATGGK